MRKIIGMLMTLIFAVLAVNLLQTEHTLETVEENVIRLHILANSDSTEDQTKKLLVRDAVLENAESWLAGCDTTAERCAALRSQLPEIAQTAEQTLRAEGCNDAVTVTFGVTAFPQRTYGRFTLPAGNYQSLNISIGAAEGQNWWCVMFPSLCIPAASDRQQETLPAAALDLTEHPERYEIRLKTVDVCRSIFRWLGRLLA